MAAGLSGRTLAELAGVHHANRVNPSMIGRDAERDRLSAFLDGIGPSMLLITGPAGIGKSTLCRNGADHARERGRRVLEFRPGPAEATLSYAGLTGLITDEVLDGVRGQLPGARRSALETALSRDDAGSTASGAAEPTAVGLGVLSVLRGIATDPVLLAIDDLQWLDPASTFVIDFALRRLGDSALSVLAAARTEDLAGSAPLEDAFPEPRRSRLPLGPLSAGALGRLVADRLHVSLPRLAAVQLADESGGNSFIALELARAAAARGAIPGPGERFQPTADVAALLGARIRELPACERDVLQVIATAARPTLTLLATLIGADAAEAAVASLVTAELTTVEGSAVRCAHPLIAAAAHAGILPAARRRLHARLAETVANPEERVRHLALSTDGPDGAVADALDEAASQAQRRGAPVAAAQLRELAVTATPPTEVDRLVTRELALARCRLDAGDTVGAREVAAGSLGRRPPGPGRVDALLLLSAVEQVGARLPEARRWLTQALDEAGPDRAALARAHVTAGMTAWEDVDTERAHAEAAVRALAGHEDEDPTSAATALVLLAGTDFEAGRGLRVDLLDRAVALEERTDLVTMMRPSTQRAIFLGHAGRIADSLPAIADCVSRATRLGDESSLPHLLRTLAWMQLGAGMLREAQVTIARATSLAAELDLADAYIWAVAGQVHAALGDADAAADLCRRAVDQARAAGNPWAEIRALAASGFAHLSADRPADAAQALTAGAEIASSGHLVEIGWHRMHGDLVEALVGCGQLTEAAQAARAFHERAELTGHPWSVGVSRRCLAQVAAATGDFEAAIREFNQGLAEPVLAQMPFERARGLLGLGVALRRANRRKDARAVLAEAENLFAAIDAGPWVERARAEAGAISGRTGDPEGLTAMQQRVAALAAAGRTNAEIAQELFLSVRTVESHLAAAYRKLGARSRTELAALLRAVAAAG